MDYVDLSKNRAFLQKAFSHRYSSCIDSLPNGAAAEGRSDLDERGQSMRLKWIIQVCAIEE